jgi:hypothetical protein
MYGNSQENCKMEKNVNAIFSDNAIMYVHCRNFG